jgi:hypothetical protein
MAQCAFAVQNESAEKGNSGVGTQGEPMTHGLQKCESALNNNASKDGERAQATEGEVIMGPGGFESKSVEQRPTTHDKVITRIDVDKSATNGGSDWRLPLVEYMRSPGGTRDKKIHRQALKYTLVDDDLYR